MPDITGWTSSEVITLCKLLDIEYTITGYGKVKQFNIEPNTKITNSTKLEITLE